MLPIDLRLISSFLVPGKTHCSQADSLRQQTLQKLHQTLTIRQAARCLVAIADYFHRLRAISTLWAARPRHDQQGPHP